MQYNYMNMEHSLIIQDLKIRYLQKGTGIPVVLLHGFSFSAETWSEIGLFDLLSADHSVYSFDMPYGSKSRSDKFDAENRDDYADFLNTMLKTLNINSPILIGASISGEVTLRYLMRGYSARSAIVIGPAGIKSLDDRFSSIAVPMLAVWGDKDTISPPANSEILKAHVKNSEVRIIEGAGHACYLDAPKKFIEIVKDFLHIRRHSRAGGNPI